MKPYPEYKASGIDWLGEIPSHWEAISLKHLSDIIMGQSPDGKEISDTGNVFFMQGNAEFGEKYPHPSLFCDTCAKYSRIGDILMSVRAPVGKLNISDNIYGIGRGLCSIKPTKIKREFLWYYLLNSKAIFNYFSNGSTFEAITVDNLKNIPVAFPKLEEQVAIAKYLDYVTGRIDTLINEKSQQIEELREYRSSLITETVTRGLNPDAPLRDSGIDWLGSIPRHWEISKSAWTFENIGSGTTPTSGLDEYYNNGTVNWLQTGDLNDGIITSTSKKITQLAVEDKGLKIYPKGSLVIAMYGATIAKSGILDIDTTVNQACCVLLPSNKVNNKFAFYYFNAAKNTLISLASGGGQPNISQAVISNFKIILPPLSDQQEIADFLDEKTANIDHLIEELTMQLDELAEYKQAVITEAVTGKVDVRDYNMNT